ncbi:TetR/AcrR family transcriptional regulator [Affinirhizobium pseudoryzae]|uniref:TetR/AcrR family transcriptional regulator n=1 Tax=Allorhizobium pseudoryzae TaxID=379684 RepID=UPI0013E9A42B|nr:TetR/AcrR family transcriptional regulator [Allorhizobium pseudoryzae]
MDSRLKAGDPAAATGVTVRRRRSPKGEERREAILRAAMARFAEDGFQNASFAAIAQDAGLTLPGLIHHFPTKVDLLIALLARRDVETDNVQDIHVTAWRQFLRGLVDVVRRNMEIAEVVRAFAVLNVESLTRNHPAENWFIERTNALRQRFAMAIAEGIKSGEIRADVSAEAIAAELIALMDGLQILWLRAPDTVDMASIFGHHIERLIRHLEQA